MFTTELQIMLAEARDAVSGAVTALDRASDELALHHTWTNASQQSLDETLAEVQRLLVTTRRTKVRLDDLRAKVRRG